MRIKNINLEWNVLLFDWDKKTTINYNIFSYGFIEIVNKKLNNNELNNLDDLKSLILRWCRRYRNKGEYEMLIGHLSIRDVRSLEKIDVFRQIEMNIDRIVEYINKELNLFN